MGKVGNGKAKAAQKKAGGNAPQVTNGDILAELRRMSSLLAVSLTKGMTRIEAADFLKRTGFSTNESASLLDATPKAIEVGRYKAKRRRSQRAADATGD